MWAVSRGCGLIIPRIYFLQSWRRGGFEEPNLRSSHGVSFLLYRFTSSFSYGLTYCFDTCGCTNVDRGPYDVVGVIRSRAGLLYSIRSEGLQTCVRPLIARRRSCPVPAPTGYYETLEWKSISFPPIFWDLDLSQENILIVSCRGAR